MIFRTIQENEWEQAARIEEICFPQNEACSRENMKARVQAAPELFLVAVDEERGRIAGFLNGISTNECAFRDDFFTNALLKDPEGENVFLLGLDVLPEYRGRGLASELVRRYAEREGENGRKLLLLTCLEDKIPMYRKMGFYDRGIANSVWGGEEWHEMAMKL